jgi:hypothetical protein
VSFGCAPEVPRSLFAHLIEQQRAGPQGSENHSSLVEIHRGPGFLIDLRWLRPALARATT